MTIKVVKEKILKEELKKITQETFETVVKVTVDIKKEILAVGGEFHSDGQEILMEQENSEIEDVWGISFYPWNSPESRIEYIALINIKPVLGNSDMMIEEKEVRDKIKIIVNNLLLKDEETLAS